jgi:hypothetical protein
MMMSIYISCNERICNEPIATKSICGETVLDLKFRLDNAIISTLRQENEKTGDYFVEYVIEDGDVCVDGEEATPCYCDLAASSVTWKPL